MDAQATAQVGVRRKRYRLRWESLIARIVGHRIAPGGAKTQSKHGHMNSEAETEAKATGSHEANEHKRTRAQLAYFSGRAH